MPPPRPAHFSTVQKSESSQFAPKPRADRVSFDRSYTTRSRVSRNSSRSSLRPRKSLATATAEQLKDRLQQYKMFAPRFTKGFSPAQGSPLLVLLEDEIRPPTAAAPSSASGSPGLETIESHAYSEDPIFNDNVFRIWLQEHPKATAEEVRVEINRRYYEKAEAERVARMAALREWQSQLADLQRQESFDRANANVEERNRLYVEQQQNKLAAMDPLVPHVPSVAKPLEKKEYERQKRAWDVFCGVNTNAATPQLQPAVHTVDGPMLLAAEGDALHAWIACKWKNHTHIHEMAALRIQCAYRCFAAKQKFSAKRFQREVETAVVLEREEKAAAAWELAIATNESKHLSKANVDMTYRVVDYWKSRLDAAVLLRRKIQSKSNRAREEVEIYAAMRIQTIYRGHRARKLLYALKHPEVVLLEQTVAHNEMATVVQSLVRRYLAKQDIKRRHVAATKIQHLYRQRLSERHLTQLRRSQKVVEMDEVAQYAARVLQRFMRGAVAKSHRRLLPHLATFKFLQATCRGYQARKVISRAKKRSLLRKVQTIQSAVRGFLAMQRVKSIQTRVASAVNEAIREDAARVVQVHCHALRARSLIAAIQSRVRAAITLQAAWRGLQTRRAIQQDRAAHREGVLALRRVEAAVTVQSFFRACIVRKSLRKQKSDSKRPLTAPVDVSSKEIAVDACDTIRRFYWNHIRVRNLRKVLAKAQHVVVRFLSRVPALYRMQKRRREVEEELLHAIQDASALVIQCAHRQHLARCHVRTARTERDAMHLRVREREAVRVVVDFLKLSVHKLKRDRRRQQQQR